ncbi:MAG TPA: PilZ domain-containing protein [Nitrospira sp.]|nr:PilZ domain-containing protein [Nitrospira sp.]
MEVSERVRSQPRFEVQWLMLYRGENFLAEGTMLDISLQGGRFAGTMPVKVGMRLAIYVDSPQKPEDLVIEEAVVRWVSEEQFGAEFIRMGADDMDWLRGYLEIAERRNSFRHLMGLSTNASEVAGMPLALPCKG